MRKIFICLFITIISIFVMSCGSHFNPRYYYNNRNSSSSSGNGGGGDLDLGDENLPPEEDPFDPGYKGDGYDGWNDENYIFDDCSCFI